MADGRTVVGLLLVTLRRQHKVSRRTLAARAGVAEHKLYALERNHVRGLPTAEEARQLLEALRAIAAEGKGNP